MPALQKIRLLLASCRRILLLSLFAATLFLVWGYWRMPDLNTLRPTIEQQLKTRLNLQSLKLGSLSWYWAGYLWIRADRLSFATNDRHLEFDQGALGVRISLIRLLFGDLIPEHVELSGGVMRLQLKPGQQPSARAQLPPLRIVLQHVRFHWRYGDLFGEIPQLQLLADGREGIVEASFPGVHAELGLDQAGLPRESHFTFEHLDWLPDEWRRKIHGDFSGNFRLRKSDEDRWVLDTALHAEEQATLLPRASWSLPFTEMNARFMLETRRAGSAREIGRVGIERAHWSLGKSSIDATGAWQDGQLEVAGKSPQLALPVLWQWLRPLGKDKWRQWLASMRKGTARQAEAKVTFSWPRPWQALPEKTAIKASLRYKVTGHVDGADLALGLEGDVLEQVRGSVSLNERELIADIQQAQLPRSIGTAAGQLRFPWKKHELYIKGTATADAGKLAEWQAAELSDRIHWHRGVSKGAFSFIWPLPSTTPREASVQLIPDGVWSITVGRTTPVKVEGGQLQWDIHQGLALQAMHYFSPHLHGQLSLTAGKIHNQWQLKSFHATGKGDFEAITAYFEIPIAGAEGELLAQLDFADHWSGSIDLTSASWENLLGSSKRKKTPYRLDLLGEKETRPLLSGLVIRRLESTGAPFPLQGSGKVSVSGLHLKLQGLETRYFAGALEIRAPFGPEVWELNVAAARLDRQALPAHLKKAVQSKSWVLRAKIGDFFWDEGRLQDVTLRLASSVGSVGLFEAARIETSKIQMQQTRARFSLLGDGRIDLRHLSANLGKQQIILSAMMHPDVQGGLLWDGFAEVSGDFGDLIQQGKFSDRFSGGKFHALFSGRGIVLRDQPWWQGLDGRLRLRVNDGRILEGGTLTRLLAALNLTELPKLLLGQRKDLTGPGLYYSRLQLEGLFQNQNIGIRNLAMRSAAFDLAGNGSLNVEDNTIDMIFVVRPLQNLDAILSKIPLLRDLLGGRARSLMRKVYRMHGPLADARVDSMDPKKAGLASGGLIEQLLSLPSRWF